MIKDLVMVLVEQSSVLQQGQVFKGHIRTRYKHLCSCLNWHIISEGYQFSFVSQDEYDTEERLLSSRSEKSKTVPGTHQFHFFSPIPNSRTLLAARHYSLCESQKIVKVSFKEEGDILAWHDLNGFLTYVYDNKQ